MHGVLADLIDFRLPKEMDEMKFELRNRTVVLNIFDSGSRWKSRFC